VTTQPSVYAVFITETNGIQLAPFGMQNRTCIPYFTTIQWDLVSVMIASAPVKLAGTQTGEVNAGGVQYSALSLARVDSRFCQLMMLGSVQPADSGEVTPVTAAEPAATGAGAAPPAAAAAAAPPAADEAAADPAPGQIDIQSVRNGRHSTHFLSL
jgi:hypothetical protein